MTLAMAGETVNVICSDARKTEEPPADFPMWGEAGHVDIAAWRFRPSAAREFRYEPYLHYRARTVGGGRWAVSVTHSPSR